MDYKFIKKTQLISQKEIYPDGANSPTIQKEYVCFCGEGKIIEERVVGFNDDYIMIKCKKCLKKYDEYIYNSGSDWKVFIKEK